MAPSRKKGKSSAATAAAARRQWKIGDLVLAKVKGFPAWPATVSEPEKWGYSTDWKKVLVYFFGTNQIAFCNPVDVEAFTEEKKEALLVKRQGRGADFVRAVQEIIKSYDKLKEQNPGDNCISENDVISTPAGNSGCSLVRCRLNDQIEADATVPNSQLDHSSSNIVRSEPGSLVEGYAAAVLPDSSHDKDVLSDEPTRDDVREKVLPSIPSRRRIGGIQSQGIVARRSNQSVRRSRTSSRADSCIFRNHAVQSNDAGKSSGAGVASLVHDGSLRRSRRIRRSPNTSRRNGMRSPDLISNGSIVDNSSEIATMDSDAPGLNGGNTLESGCNAEDADPIQCLEGEVELGKRLELQINTVFVKKKRKPNRKRGFNGTPEFTIEADRSGGLDSQIHGTRETSADTSNKLNERCSKDGGDEHLPLLKRARVRMGKQSAVSEEPSSIKQLDESSSKEAPVKPSGRNCISLNGSPTDDFSEVKSSSRSCLNTCTEDGPYHSKVMSQLCNSVDGEAVLPPSKRLHRALEAMSANAIVDGEICVEAPLIRRTSTIEDCSQISTEGHVGGPCSIEETACCSGCNASKEEHSFEFCATVNPQNSEKNKCRVCAGIINQQDGNAETARYFETVESVTTENSKLSLLNLEGGNSPRNNRGSFNKLSCENEMRQRSEYLSAHGAGNRDEVLLKLTGEIPDSALATNETVVFSPRVGTAEPPLNEAENNCEENESARLHQDTSCCSQIDSVFCVVAEETKQVPSQVLKASPVQVAQHSVHSVSTFDEHPGGKVVAGSPSPADEENSLDHLSIVDDRNRVQDNGRCSPDAHMQRGKLSTGLDKDGRHDAVTQHPTSTNKRSNQGEANAALRSFEGMLGTLTRMKESIGRATRVAIDCAKFGLASKVVDILARSLESEESLYRRVDLFFLVDSITQCSRSLRGDARGTYPTAVQALLPRLLSAAAPPGSAAQENRRQCLKVLRLWLERKILPEPVVRHHMRCLDSHGSSSSSGAFSRRSSRTERAFDDPIRGMEGMLVDEYGSNSSFQLPGFSMPRMLKIDEGSDSDGENFEAVTPEHNPAPLEASRPVSLVGKRRHILEDVDGELEMEDVAPSHEAESASMNCEQHVHPPFAPTLPSGGSPFSPPLPVSPPPVPPPPPLLPLSSLALNPSNGGGELKLNTGGHVSIRPAGNALPQMDGPTLSNGKAYNLRPPQPTPSDQFSYVQADLARLSRRDAPPPSYSNRYHFEHNMDGANLYGDHDRTKLEYHESHDNWSFSGPSFHGPPYPPDKPAMSFSPVPCESGRVPNQGWHVPPPPLHRNKLLFRPAADEVPVASRAAHYWHPQ